MKRSASCRVVLSIATLFVSLALLRAQDSTSGTSAGSAGEPWRCPLRRRRFRKSRPRAQNPVFGSVPDAKPTPGVLPLTFQRRHRARLRHNLAGLLSEYNTIQARGEKWEQLSRLLPNVSADVQEVAEKESLQALRSAKRRSFWEQCAACHRAVLLLRRAHLGHAAGFRLEVDPENTARRRSAENV